MPRYVVNSPEGFIFTVLETLLGYINELFSMITNMHVVNQLGWLSMEEASWVRFRVIIQL